MNVFNFSLLQKIEILFKRKGIDNPEKERKAKMSNRTQSIAKPFCKVCHDAGKTVAEYSTHYVRESRGGAVVCPTILNQQCNYCKKHGHTPSHCPALQAKQAHEAKQIQAQARLCELPRMESKISAPVIKPVALKMNSWASVVSKKPAHRVPEEQEQAQRVQAPQEQEPEEQAQEEQAPAFNYSNMAWADVE